MFTTAFGFYSVPTNMVGPKYYFGGNFTSYQGVLRNRITMINTDGSLVSTFDIGDGFNSNVTSINIQSDGKILVGGQFTTYKGLVQNRIGRLNTDGSLDSTFNIGTGFDSSVSSIETQSDGKLLVGGFFTQYNGFIQRNLARLRTDGLLDSTFDVATKLNNAVTSIKIQSDNKILIGGGFTTYSSLNAPRYFNALNTNGGLLNDFNLSFNNDVNSIKPQLDNKILVGGNFTAYNPINPNFVKITSGGSLNSGFNLGIGFNGVVYSFAVQSDGKILVGGQFFQYKGLTQNYIVRLNTDGSLDTTFAVGTGFNNIVRSIYIQSDGKILVGGDFTTYKGLTQTRIARLNTDGSLDSSFVIGTGFNSSVTSINIQSDGKILVGGDFTTYKGLTQNYIVRLNTDGSLDSTFVIGGGFNSFVNSINIQSDGKIVVGGAFTTYKGLSQNRIARLNTDGSLDSTFVIGTGFSGNVNSIETQSDGKLLVGGFFIFYKGLTQNRIARLNTDGSLDSTFDIGTGFNGGPNSINIQSDGKIVVGGAFTTYKGLSQNNMVRLNTDGSLDSSLVNLFSSSDTFINKIYCLGSGDILIGGSFATYGGNLVNRIIRFNSGGSVDSTFVIGDGFNSIVRSIDVQSDGKIVVGGDFSSYSGLTQNYIVRLNTGGSLDSSFVIGTGFNNIVRSIYIQSDGKILVGGDFTTYKGLTQTRIARLNTDGSLDSSFVIGTGFNSNVTSINIQSDGKILVGGGFNTYKGLTQNYIVRLNTDGSLDSTFVIGTGFNLIVNSIEVQSDGKILVVGNFTTYKGLTQNRIIRLNTDGSLDSSFVIGAGFNGGLNSINIQSDGKILVGGGFNTYNGLTQNRIARLNTDGSLDLTLIGNPNVNGLINSIYVKPDGVILIGGGFTTSGGIFTRYIARLNTDGSLDSTFVIGGGFNFSVFSIYIQSDGKIVAGGNFTTYNGLAQNRIIRLNTDGSLDTTFFSSSGFNGIVTSIYIQSDGKILVGGDFTTYKGLTQNRIARLNTDGSLDSTFVIGGGFNFSVNSINIQSDGKILVGGSFTTYKGLVQDYIVRLNTDGSLDSTFDINSGFDNGVASIYTQSDGKILVGGVFTKYRIIDSNRIIGINDEGLVDFSFNVGTGFNNNVIIAKKQSNGKILVGGQFSTYKGLTQNRIARLNTDGSLDSSFNILGGFNNTVNSIGIQSDGKILVSGAFTVYRPNIVNFISVLNENNGSLDSTFDIGTGFNNAVRSTYVQSDGKILVGGQFTTYKGLTQNNIARLNTDGSLDSSFDIGVGFNSTVNSIYVQSDGKILVGGDFTTYKGLTQNYIARLNTDGSLDSTFDIGTGFNIFVFSIYTQSDGKILVGGQFTAYKGLTQNCIARLNTDGSLDSTFDIGGGFNSTVNSIDIQSDGKILAVGNFTTYKGLTQNRIARLNTDGSLDSSFVIGTGFNNGMNSIEVLSDGKILVGGNFTTYKGLTQNRIARLNTDGSLDSTFDIGGGFNLVINSIEVLSDGKILVGGQFTTYKGLTQNRIIRLNTDGSLDSTFVIGGGFNSTVITIMNKSNGKIMVGGSFTTYGGSEINRIARLNTDGSVDSTFDVGTGFNFEGLSFYIQSDGKILVGGNFTTYKGLTQNRIIRLNTDGSLDSTFVIGGGFNFSVFSIYIQSDGKIVAGGNFTTYNGLAQNRIIRLNTDGSLDTTFFSSSGFNGIVTSIYIQSDGKILVGGNFFTYQGQTFNRIIRLNEDGLPDSTFNIGIGFNSTVNSIYVQSDGKIVVAGQFTTYKGLAQIYIARLNTDGSLDSTFDIGTGPSSFVNTIGF